MSIELERAAAAAPKSQQLPVRVKHTAAEDAELFRWRLRYGDDEDKWPVEIRRAYANTIANMRAGGAL